MDGSKRRGAFLHPLCAFTPDGVPLGTVAAHVWTRPDEPALSAAERQARRKALPIEQKESQRWIDMLRRGQELACQVPGTQLICVADSEADIYEHLAEAQAEPRRVDWIVRAAGDRALQDDAENPASAGLLHAEVMKSKVLFTKTITVRAREPKVACAVRGRCQPRQARKAEVEVRAARVTLHPPYRRDRKLPPLTVNVVLVREIAPPAGEEPVEWMLLTSLPIATAEEVAAVIQYYLCALDDGNFVSHVEVRLSRRGATLRDHRSALALCGGLPDCELADAVRVPDGTEPPGRELRSRSSSRRSGSPHGASFAGRVRPCNRPNCETW